MSETVPMGFASSGDLSNEHSYIDPKVGHMAPNTKKTARDTQTVTSRVGIKMNFHDFSSLFINAIRNKIEFQLSKDRSL